MSTHTAVIHIPRPSDPESVALAAAHASLALLTKVSASRRGAVTIQSVTITEPEGLAPPLSLESLFTTSSPTGKAVVVVANLEEPSTNDEGTQQ